MHVNHPAENVKLKRRDNATRQPEKPADYIETRQVSQYVSTGSKPICQSVWRIGMMLAPEPEKLNILKESTNRMVAVSRKITQANQIAFASDW
jgi:hypothetical protein